METPVEIRYAGVVVGRSNTVQMDADGAGAFVGFAEPLPVGTPVTLKTSERTKEGRVTEVIESADSGAAGMRVRFGSADADAPEETSDHGSQPTSGDGGGRKRRRRR